MHGRCVLTLVVLLGSAWATAQEPAPDATTENVQKTLAFSEAESKRYRIFHSDDPKAALELVEKPVLKWSNPLKTEVHGTVVVFLRGGCPEAVGAAFHYFARQQVNMELVSLTDVPLTGERNGRVRWKAQAGVEWKAVPNAPIPAATAGRRRFQARELSRKFQAEIGERDAQDNLSQLRLLSRPLHEYQATDTSGRDGSLFAFAVANDPDTLIAIESRPTKEGREWVYAVARLSYQRLRVSLADNVVWDVPQLAPPWENLRGPDGTYVALQWRSPEDAARDGAEP